MHLLVHCTNEVYSFSVFRSASFFAFCQLVGSTWSFIANFTSCFQFYYFSFSFQVQPSAFCHSPRKFHFGSSGFDISIVQFGSSNKIVGKAKILTCFFIVSGAFLRFCWVTVCVNGTN